MDWHTVVFVFVLTLFAGLATGVGSAIAFFARITNTRFLSVSLGFFCMCHDLRFIDQDFFQSQVVDDLSPGGTGRHILPFMG